MRGAVRRLRREHNDRAWLAWHTARLTAYAPENGRNFTPLSNLQMRVADRAAKRTGWQNSFRAFEAWAAAKRKG